MVIIWFLGAFIVGFFGIDRKIGYWGSFFASVFLSPLIGLIITLFSETNANAAYKKKQLELLENRNNETTTVEVFPKTSKEERLKELADLKSKELISEEEYITSRKKIIDS